MNARILKNRFNYNFKEVLSLMLIGGATSASQYEGGFKDGKGVDTQDCRKYIIRTEKATTNTRLLSYTDIEEAKNNKELYYPFRKGSKGYENSINDIELISELGLEIYRFSLSWSRLFPTGEEAEPNKKGVKFYDNIINELNDRGIKIFLTLNHYGIPINLIEKYGGWKNRKLINYYLNFTKFAIERWGRKVDYILPFNEINAGYFSPYNGIGLLKNNEDGYNEQDIFQGLHHQFVATAKTIKFARKINISAKFCSMISCFCYYPLTAKPKDNLKLLQDEQMNQWFCSDILLKGIYPYYAEKYFKDNNILVEFKKGDTEVLKNNTSEIFSFSYYSSSVVSTTDQNQTAGNLVSTIKNPFLEATDWGWQIDPIGLKITLHKAYDRYHVPLIVSECGLGEKDKLTDENNVHDQYRIDYLQEHLSQVTSSIDEGVPVEAFISWGIIDIVSAGSCEMSKRYGVVYVDADNKGKGTYKRYKKDSFYWLKNYIKSKN